MILFAAAAILSVYAYVGSNKDKLILHSYGILIVGFIAGGISAGATISQGGGAGLLGVGSMLAYLIIGSLLSVVVIIMHGLVRHS